MSSAKQTAGASPVPMHHHQLLRTVITLILGTTLVLAGCSPSDSPDKEASKDQQTSPAIPISKPKVYAADKINCSTFTADDAAAILGVPATEIQLDAQELYAGNYLCGYKVESSEKMVSFNISLAKSGQDAANDMAQYRQHLDIAKNTKPFKDNLAKGAYSDISGIGDDALWTDVNGTLMVRKGNLSLQVQLPKEKEAQLKVAQRFLLHL
jgi:hypothetical protein